MENSLFAEFIGKKISNISRVCDLVCIEFKSSDQETVSLHIQSFFRFIKNNKVFICSDDMCRCDSQYENEEFEWDVPGKSVYDKSIIKHYDMICDSAVLQINQNSLGDLTIAFENDIALQIFVDTTETEEKYRIINQYDHIVFNS